MSHVIKLATSVSNSKKMIIVDTPRYIDSIIDLYARLEEIGINHTDLTNLVALVGRDVLDNPETYEIKESHQHAKRTVQLPALSDDYGNYSFNVTHFDTDGVDLTSNLESSLFDIILDEQETFMTRFIAARYISGEFEQLGEVDVFLPTDKFSKIIPVVESKKEIEDTYKFDTASLSLSLTDGIVLIV